MQCGSRSPLWLFGGDTSLAWQAKAREITQKSWAWKKGARPLPMSLPRIGAHAHPCLFLSPLHSVRAGVAVTAFRSKAGSRGVALPDLTSVLLVQRLSEPAKGQWALPGGKLKYGEPILRCAVREFLEETGLHVCVPSSIARVPLALLSPFGALRSWIARPHSPLLSPPQRLYMLSRAFTMYLHM